MITLMKLICTLFMGTVALFTAPNDQIASLSPTPTPSSNDSKTDSENHQQFTFCQSLPQHSYNEKLKNITSSILDGHKVLIILRGLPGSGKTYLANSIVNSTVGGDPNQFIFSTDDYFVMLGRGVYQFDAAKLTDTHYWNEERVSKVLKEGMSPVIVDNTNTQSWNFRSYVESGIHNGYRIEVLEPNTPWSRNITELARRNVHGVPEEKLRKKAETYECDITGAKLIEQFSLHYTAQNVPPQIRKFPHFKQ